MTYLRHSTASVGAHNTWSDILTVRDTFHIALGIYIGK